MPRVLYWRGGAAGRPPGRIGADTRPQIFGISVNACRIGATVAVTIYGANFRNCPNGNPPQVYFGDLQATSVVVVDQGTITCVSPVATEPGVVDVSVTTGCCQ